ncbi:MAG TPA: BBE domain-containing protein, partial [Thermoanaerobaculia bacterium]|nr:BBE domain-containing protein [Thermoanaerobaculia bacterium]
GAFHAQMRHYTSDQCYQNFIDASERDWRRAYYGANFDRLVDVKTKYDRHNVFQFPQSIPIRRHRRGPLGLVS